MRRRSRVFGHRAAAALAAGGLGLIACDGGTGTAADPSGPLRVVVLGIDGMDHALAERMMAAGEMPHFARIAEAGTFQPLGTSAPPLSPVAWSDFITGHDAGGHGIFDFFHRDPETMIPYLSTSRTVQGERHFDFRKWRIPLDSDRTELLRGGVAFWELLEHRGIETTIVRIPANFPVSGTASRELSGMGTPDVLGTYGTFSLYTSTPYDYDMARVSGGDVYRAYPSGGAVEALLHGPDNTFLVEAEEMTAPFTVHIDPDRPLAKLEVGAEERLLSVGEWSDWVPVEFELLPFNTLQGICRFYLRSVRPEFELYVSPINIAPSTTDAGLSHPGSWAGELAELSGLYYTQGMPEDTKAVTSGVLDRDEFLAQAMFAGDELIAQFDTVLADFETGLLFYYFGSLDQISHLLWRAMDPDHPAYDRETDPKYADVVPGLYRQYDALVGRIQEQLGPETLLVVMSDHGFTSWRRSFHINAWLREEGFLTVRDPGLVQDRGLFSNVDWSGTRAYGLGLNSLYVNVAGRERNGIVPAPEKRALLEEIRERLLAYPDPETGQPAVSRVYIVDEYYQDAGYRHVGPDMVIGYAKMTRGSDESALGGVGRDILTDNLSEWSGDHGMDHETVPGILLTSRPLARQATSLQNLAASILAEFGVTGFPPERTIED